MVHTLRMNRGYKFEKYIIEELNTEGWQARRLGGSSVGLPDIAATNNKESLILAIEAKSTVGKYCSVPQDQIIRCNDLLNLFGVYKNTKIILAFKFGTKGKKGNTIYHFLIIPYINTIILNNIKSINCNKDGFVTIIHNKGFILTDKYDKHYDEFSIFTYHNIGQLKKVVIEELHITDKVGILTRAK
jgi:Holliday junction resolvase